MGIRRNNYSDSSDNSDTDQDLPHEPGRFVKAPNNDETEYEPHKLTATDQTMTNSSDSDRKIIALPQKRKKSKKSRTKQKKDVLDFIQVQNQNKPRI